MKNFNKMTEGQMTKANGGAAVVTLPTIVGAILTFGATSAAGAAIGGFAARESKKSGKQ